MNDTGPVPIMSNIIVIGNFSAKVAQLLGLSRLLYGAGRASLPFDNAQGLEFIEKPLPFNKTFIF
jgi:hypothetical protein